jgi:uncharacterized protein YbjT (DUF2867 family)
MTTPTKTIAVIGATGNQGSSVVKTFVQLPGWHVRAITRSPSSEKAQALEALGAEVVQADLADPASLASAFAGVHAIFVNTDFWSDYRSTGDSKSAYDGEVQRGKNAADAAAAVPTLERFVYSALGPMAKASGGKYVHSYHWESKAAIVEYVESAHAGGLAGKTSVVYIGAYATNAFLQPKLDPNSGAYAMVMPAPETTRFPIIDPTASTGPFVRALVVDEEPGTKLLAYDTDSYLSMGEVLALWSRATGKEARFVQMSLQAIHELTKVPLEILDGAGFLGEFPYTAGVEGVIEPGQLKNKVVTTSYEEFLKTQSMDLLLGSELPKP